jgi:hypothetical protein
MLKQLLRLLENDFLPIPPRLIVVGALAQPFQAVLHLGDLPAAQIYPSDREKRRGLRASLHLREQSALVLRCRLTGSESVSEADCRHRRDRERHHQSPPDH